MVYVLKIDGFLSMLSVAAQSRDGDLVVSVEVLEVADIPRLCLLVRWVLEVALLLQLDPEDLLAVFAAGLAEGHVAEGLEEASVVAIDLTSVEEEEALDIKAEVDLEEEVGMVVARLTAMVMAQHHPLMHPLVLEEEEGLVAVTAALL